MPLNVEDGWFCDRAVGKGKVIDARPSGGPVGIGSGASAVPLTDTTLTFYGFYHLIGQTVQASIGGIDCGDYTVSATGSIEVDFGSDDQGIMTAEYLASLDGFEGEQATEVTYYLDDELITVTVPVVIGMAYTSQGQGLRPAAQQDLRIDMANGLGRTRRGHKFAALMVNTGVTIAFGTDLDGTMDAVEFKQDDGETDMASSSLWSAVYRGTLTDPYNYDTMLCWEMSRPWPATVCAVSTYLAAEQ